ncbi:MAG TPA: M13-type metalloendopeptidase [Caulobacteraceae bacterium]|nr:M13-type metalloendopeptidase [Caulobacteraceae bacterium]
MKIRLLAASAAALLSLVAAGSAGARTDVRAGSDCLDMTCAVTALVPADPNTIEGGSTVGPRYGTWGLDLSGRDLSVRPGDDFYRYANGTWDAHAEIPADRTRYGNFDRLSILSENRTRAIIEAAAAGQSADPDAAKIGDAWRAFMNEAAVEALDAKPLAPDLAAIRRARTRQALATLMGTSNDGFQSTIFGVGIGADGKAPDKYAVYLGTGGMGLPDRDYYLEAALADKKAKYQAYVAQMLTLAGWPNAEAAAKAVVDYETKIAEASWTRAQRRDRDKTYNPMTLAQLQAAAPQFAWKPFMAKAGLKGVDRFVVTTNTAVPKIAQIYAATPVATLQAWAAFHVVDSAAPFLSKRFVDARFAFRNHELAGQPEQMPRWKRGVGFVNGALGESVGRLYVAQYFPPESKAKMEALIHDLETALGGRIQRLTWMSPETKAKALEKLAKLTVKVGYPVKWRDYGAFRVAADDLYGDAARSTSYDWRYDVNRLNQPVDKQEWGMTPQTVNAYYNATNNEIVFPAAILQPPFFDPNADAAVNYGGIGGVIGHEMTHGFDDQGRKSDGTGMLTDWWTAEDAAKFKAQAERLGAQYSSYEPVPGFHIKGDQTMGENIADMGGLLIALDAYHASLRGQPSPVLDGVTGDQRVFLAWAQVWRQKQRPEAAVQQTKSDPHSAPEFRVIGPTRNNDAWYDAFGVTPDQKYYLAPDQRVRIW